MRLFPRSRGTDGAATSILALLVGFKLVQFSSVRLGCKFGSGCDMSTIIRCWCYWFEFGCAVECECF
jgi:hypothetical protein